MNHENRAFFKKNFILLITFLFVFLLFYFFVSAVQADLIVPRSQVIKIQLIRPDLPQCANGLDDDLDGKIDFPEDPGCESEEDNDETDPLPPVLPPVGEGGGISYPSWVLPPKPRVPPREEILKRVDFNGDGKVDLVDLSILLFYHNKTGPQIVRYDLNSDRKIDLIDISILLYYWT